MFIKPTVTLLASTKINELAIGHRMEIQEESTDAETLTVFAGRQCYESFHRPNTATYEDADYLARTLYEQKHWSIAEHATATLLFEGVSRAFTHELIRHRHLSYSQLSQRFVDESYAKMVVPPAIRELENGVVKRYDLDAIDEIAGATQYRYDIIVSDLIDEGLPRKQAREAARAVLPNMTETKIVVTGNLRAWYEVIERRTAPDADAEMQEVMGQAKRHLAVIAPTIFGGSTNE
nr:MAG TPA: Thymidylate synthase complementing protein [Caudoviricetes sp.]